ncbi:MAG: DUF2790 domain-containing protein [Pseudomonas sp.]|nr:DUF2790 domain-containing protein [Pseudomonas sp.]
MNTRLLLSAAVLAAAFIPAMALAQTPDEPYSYGMKLDVAKVISMTEPTPKRCKVVTAEMTYQDSAGQIKTVNYQKLDSVCETQN